MCVCVCVCVCVLLRWCVHAGFEDVLWLIVKYLVPVVCVHIRRASAIQGSGLEGCLQFRGLD